MDDIGKALENMTAAIAACEGALKSGDLLDESELAQGCAMRGALFFQTGEFDKAVEDFGRCIDILARLCKVGKSPNEEDLAKACAGRGMAHHVVGRQEKALADTTACIEIWERLKGAGKKIDKGTLLQAYLTRGGICNYMHKNMDAAIRDFEEGLKIANEPGAAGMDSVKGSAYMGLGQCYDQKEEYMEANRHYDKCIAIWEKYKGDDGPMEEERLGNLATAYMNRGVNYSAIGDEDKALPDYDKCVGIRERLRELGVEQDAIIVSMSYRNRAISRVEAGDGEAAISDYVLAVSALVEQLGERPELNGIYTDYLNELTSLIEEEGKSMEYADVIRSLNEVELARGKEAAGER
jgi:tetratricopeptide (TPR) repeat protein